MIHAIQLIPRPSCCVRVRLESAAVLRSVVGCEAQSQGEPAPTRRRADRGRAAAGRRGFAA